MTPNCEAVFEGEVPQQQRVSAVRTGKNLMVLEAKVVGNRFLRTFLFRRREGP
jgi:hypothetical protein